MPHTERARRKARESAKSKRALIDPDEPRPDMGPGIPLSETQMLANLERAWDRGQGSGASRCFGRTAGLGKGNGRVGPAKEDY